MIVSISIGSLSMYASGLESLVSSRTLFNLSQQGLNEKNVIPAPNTPPITGIDFFAIPVRTVLSS